MDQVRKLPDTDLTREIAIRLAAADGEQLLLRRLLASDGSLTETILALPKNPAIDGDSLENGLALSAPPVFHVFDAHITRVNKLRRDLMN